jgi:hypothetical protein
MDKECMETSLPCYHGFTIRYSDRINHEHIMAGAHYAHTVLKQAKLANIQVEMNGLPDDHFEKQIDSLRYKRNYKVANPGRCILM